MLTANEISKLLAQRAEDVARKLLPNGKRVGSHWVAGSIAGEQGESLKVCLIGGKVGVFCDFATDDKGDLLDLWHLNRNISLPEAMKEAKAWLGISEPTFAAHTPKNFAKPSRTKVVPLSVQSPVRQYLMHERRLSEGTLAAFKIGEQSNEIIFPYYRENELINIKYLSLDRPEGKKKIRAEASCEPCLFGWQAISSSLREITLCEGEIDAMTLHQYGVPALSVPFGGGKGAKQQWIETEYDRLLMFDKINLCFDNDSAGHAAVEELLERLGRHRCFIVKLPHKDANACLLAGMSQETILKLFDEARTLDPDELKPAQAYVEQVISEFYPPDGCEIGIDPPWEKARGKVLFRPDELSIWTGINGHGKSMFLGQIILHAMKQGARICIASLELKPKRLLMRLTRQASALPKPSENYIRAIHEWYGEQLWLFDLVGTAKSQRLLEVFRYARQRYGIDMFVIDSFMKLDIAEDDYKAQKSFIEQLCDFKNQHNCHVHLVVHPRKNADESQAPGKLDNKGTGAISDLADNCFCIWRNKKKEHLKRLNASGVILKNEELKELSAADCLWICDKQRNGDWESKLGFWFDLKSYQYLGDEHHKPTQYVDYSEKTNRNLI